MAKNDFLPDGKKTMYWENGNKRMECTFLNGKKVGEAIIYNEDGVKVQTINYSNGFMEGTNTRYKDNKVISEYVYSSGTLTSNKEYLNNILVGEYRYEDKFVFVDSDSLQPPPVGSIYHAVDGKHPSEVYKGTLWTFIENSYLTDGDQPVAVWLREPNGGKGPYIYVGPFTEYYSDGSKLRVGSYTRIIQGNDATSILDGSETLYRKGGVEIYNANWNNGKKVGRILFKDDKGREWKRVNIDDDEKYTDGIYRIWDIGYDDKVLEYNFDANTQVATLKLQK